MAASEPTPVYIKRIENRLDQLFDTAIDVTDLASKTPADARHAFLQRALPPQRQTADARREANSRQGVAESGEHIGRWG